MECVEEICFWVGLVAVSVFLVKVIQRLIVKPFDLHSRYNGGWAVVTGGTDGIGLGFCGELARLGFNLCVVSRNKNKIQSVCNKLKQANPGIQTKVVVADFANSFQSGFYQQLYSHFQQLDVSLLVNNVGYLSSMNNFDELDPNELFKENTLNMMPVTMLSRYFFIKMQKRNKSGIINLSSFSANFNLAKSPNYGSTKQFINRMTDALRYEEGAQKIDILSLKPNLVTTEMTRNMTTVWHCSVNDCVRGALRALGRYPIHSGSWRHEIVQFITTSPLPSSLIDFICGNFYVEITKKYQIIDAQKNKNV